MDNQQQGNGWVGGSLGTGLGTLGALATQDKVNNFVLDTLSGTPKILRQIDLEKAKRDSLSDLLGREGRGNHQSHPKYMDWLDSAMKVDELGRTRNDAYAKVSPQATALSYLYRFGLPITAGLLGSTLTD